MSADAETSLIVDVAGFPLDGAPAIEVRDRRLRLVTRTLQNERCAVEPGLYVVRVPGPDGRHLAQLVDVAPGEEAQVLLSEGTARYRERIALTAVAAMSAFTGPAAGVWEHSEEPDVWYARVVSGATGEQVDVPPPGSESMLQLSKRHHSVLLTFDLHEVYEPSLFLQVARPGMVPLNVGLPAAAGGSARVRVDVDGQAGRFSVAAAPAYENERAVVLAAYLGQGAVQQATEIAAQVLEPRDPVEAILTGLALLRGRHPAARAMRWPGETWSIVDEAAVTGCTSDLEALLVWADTAAVPVFAETLALFDDPRMKGVLTTGRARLVASRADLGTLMTTFVASDPSDGGKTQEWVDDFDTWFTFRRQELLEGLFA